MDVFLIDPEYHGQGEDEAKKFMNVVLSEFITYGVPYYVVKKENLLSCKTKIESDSILVLFNQKIDSDSGTEKEIYDFINIAKNKRTIIWSIAMDKKHRSPREEISKKQSYDVWEQLRNRDIDNDYLPVIAKAFSRKIISRILPTIYCEEGSIFISHRRVDGEEIAADLCDAIAAQSPSTNTFRDVVNVEVGEEAQEVIDSVMCTCDAFVYVHTKKSAESKWIQKELRYALLRNIPVLWIQIDDAPIEKLRFKPSEKPHMKLKSLDFADQRKVKRIADEILHSVFALCMLQNSKVYDALRAIEKLFNTKMDIHDKHHMIYELLVSRKGYNYPQRDIRQYVQLFGRTPKEEDRKAFKVLLNKEEMEYDSSVILTDRIIKRENHGKMVVEPFEDFYFHWKEYFNPPPKYSLMRKESPEIVISGAFPAGDEMCKQSLTDALILFAKSILHAGYQLTFGAHPTFQELFFEIASDMRTADSGTTLNMYISKWFEQEYVTKKQHFLKRANMVETDGKETLLDSLTYMRREMIQRDNVVALVCLGGKNKANQSEEGIREEIALAKAHQIPVFVVGTVGGCSSKVASEYSKNGWGELNNAPQKLNNLFMESLDYFAMSQDMLSYIEESNCNKC